VSCPHCQEAARFVGYRDKRLVSLVGDIRLSRAYYHCGSCGAGHVPWDETLRLSPQSLTPAAQEVTALAGTQESFGKAAERTLRKLAGLRVCESTVERSTEAAGERLGERLQAGAVFGEKRTWAWHRDAAGRACAYVSLDLTGVLMQGPGGSKVEGRMVHVGMIYNPQPRLGDEEALSKPCDGVRGCTPWRSWGRNCVGKAPRWAWTRPSNGSRSVMGARVWRSSSMCTSRAR